MFYRLVSVFCAKATDQNCETKNILSYGGEGNERDFDFVTYAKDPILSEVSFYC